MKRLVTVLCCALAVGKALSAVQPVFAQGPANLPIATGLSPGDVLLNDFRNGWLKYEPASKQLFALDWPQYLEGVGKLGLDVDGSILHLVGAASLYKLNPVTGQSTLLTETGAGNNFAVLPDGDILFYKPASRSSKTGGVWSGGVDSVFHRYDRSSGTTMALPKPQRFSPRSVRFGDNGEVFVHDFFRGIQHIDLATGVVGSNPHLDISTDAFAGISPSGEFVVHDWPDGIVRISSDTGVATPISGDGFFPLLDIVVDEFGDIWSISPSAFRFIDGDTGEVSSLLANQNPWSFIPQSMLVIPSGWTPPSVPEPTALTLAVMGLSGISIAVVRRARYV